MNKKFKDSCESTLPEVDFTFKSAVMLKVKHISYNIHGSSAVSAIAKYLTHLNAPESSGHRTHCSELAACDQSSVPDRRSLWPSLCLHALHVSFFLLSFVVLLCLAAALSFNCFSFSFIFRACVCLCVRALASLLLCVCIIGGYVWRVCVCSDDEHMLIQHYCQSLNQGSPLSQPRSPAQILISMETEEKGELERVLNDLEQENRSVDPVTVPHTPVYTTQRSHDTFNGL